RGVKSLVGGLWLHGPLLFPFRKPIVWLLARGCFGLARALIRRSRAYWIYFCRQLLAIPRRTHLWLRDCPSFPFPRRPGRLLYCEAFSFGTVASITFRTVPWVGGAGRMLVNNSLSPMRDPKIKVTLMRIAICRASTAFHPHGCISRWRYAHTWLTATGRCRH